MLPIRTAKEAHDAAVFFEKQNKVRQLLAVYKDIDEAVYRGNSYISAYPPNFLYKDTITTLQSLGYNIQSNRDGYTTISWEKGNER